ncbi:MAG: hypothetical protein AAF501_21070, partial [Pseudomonadota bacterium]
SGGETARTYVYVEHFSDEGPTRSNTMGWAIRDERYKLVAVDGQPQILFDLATDPFERTDLLAGEVSDEALAVAAGLRAAHVALIE